ncbi:MAG: hypothetical protein OEX02_00740 [Cyclobacteriaceae bacterium]|nr:hypothetical protein [Cyclobacteriaceae bacterium]
MMFNLKLAGFLLSLNAFFQNITFDPGRQGFYKGKNLVEITALAKISGEFTESSGLEYGPGNNFYTHKDSGASARLYRFDYSGNIYEVTDLTGVTNIDWEDMARDEAGNYYVGDFGNNLNKRTNLVIYKVTTGGVQEIKFNYDNQCAFPPAKRKMDFDCEAMFWYNNHLYLFSKNRGSNWVKAYKVPDDPGNYSLAPIDSFYSRRMVTAADIDLDTRQFGLLTYGMIYYFQLEDDLHVFSRPDKAVKFTRSGQAEGFLMLPGHSGLITNEMGKIFLLQPAAKNP